MRTVFKIAILMSFISVSHAAGFHYCQGKVTNLVTRASVENTQFMIEGLNGSPRIGYGGSTQSDMQQRQFSMLMAAYMAGKTVTLEFEDNTLNCSSNHDNILVRFVSFP